MEDELSKERSHMREEAVKTIRSASKKHQKLLKASIEGNDEKIVKYLGNEKVDINCRDTNREETPLHYASAGGNLTTVDYLLTRGANVNSINPKGQTPLFKAVYYDYAEIARLLVKHGATVNMRDQDGLAPISLASSRNLGGMFATLIELGASIHPEGNFVPIAEAAARGFAKGIKAILERDPSYVNYQNEKGNTPLHLAVINQHTGSIAALLAFKPNLQLKNNGNYTAAQIAINAGFNDVAKILQSNFEVKAKAEDTYSVPDASQNTKSLKLKEKTDGKLQILLKKKWVECRVEIKAGTIYIYDPQTSSQRGLMNILGVQMKQYQPDKLPFAFEIVSSSGSSLVIKTETSEEMLQWQFTIKKQQANQNLQADVNSPEYENALYNADVVAHSWQDLIRNLERRLQQSAHLSEWKLLEERDALRPEALSSEAVKEINRTKNRYQNIIPFDNSRVRLGELGDDRSDYINATYISLFNRWFIASQAPLPNTFFDFFKMIWENGSDVVVMLTKFEEGGKIKAQPYIPDDLGTIECGPFMVQLVAVEQVEATVVKRVKLYRDGMEKLFTHIHYTDWPDHSVPTKPSFFQLDRLVNDTLGESTNPIVAHCSAGIAQTSCWILLNSLIKVIDEAYLNNYVPSINLMKTLDIIRSQRRSAVTSVDQYTFCYEVVVDYLKNLLGMPTSIQRTGISRTSSTASVGSSHSGNPTGYFDELPPAPAPPSWQDENPDWGDNGEGEEDLPPPPSYESVSTPPPRARRDTTKSRIVDGPPPMPGRENGPPPIPREAPPAVPGRDNGPPPPAFPSRANRESMVSPPISTRDSAPPVPTRDVNPPIPNRESVKLAPGPPLPNRDEGGPALSPVKKVMDRAVLHKTGSSDSISFKKSSPAVEQVKQTKSRSFLVESDPGPREQAPPGGRVPPPPAPAPKLVPKTNPNAVVPLTPPPAPRDNFGPTPALLPRDNPPTPAYPPRDNSGPAPALLPRDSAPTPAFPPRDNQGPALLPRDSGNPGPALLPRDSAPSMPPRDSSFKSPPVQRPPREPIERVSSPPPLPRDSGPSMPPRDSPKTVAPKAPAPSSDRFKSPTPQRPSEPNKVIVNPHKPSAPVPQNPVSPSPAPDLRPKAPVANNSPANPQPMRQPAKTVSSPTPSKVSSPIAKVASPAPAPVTAPSPVSSSNKPVSAWSVEDVCRWLDSMEMSDCKETFQKNKISGSVLLELNAEDLKDELNLPLGYRKQITKAIKELQGK